VLNLRNSSNSTPPRADHDQHRRSSSRGAEQASLRVGNLQGSSQEQPMSASATGASTTNPVAGYWFARREGA
jgi:hypothetical protein